MPSERTSISGSSRDRLNLLEHPGYASLFAPGRLTVGLIMPLETYPDGPAPTMRRHLEMAAKADEGGFGALWMRDIPFYDPGYGDLGQVFEPLVYIATLAAVTRSIALGTAGIVLPLRDPRLLAKQVNSLDQLTGGRMLLGMSSGDRPSEYPMFDVDFDTRGERFRDAFDVYRSVAEDQFPSFQSPAFGHASGRLDLLPKPPTGHTPMIGIGHAQQSPEWIAANMDGMITSTPPRDKLDSFVSSWQRAVDDADGGGDFKPLGIAGYLDLVPDRDHPFERLRSGIRSGSRSLADFLEAARVAGVSHAALNPKISRRPYVELMADLEEDVLPHFPVITPPARAGGCASLTGGCGADDPRRAPAHYHA